MGKAQFSGKLSKIEYIAAAPGGDVVLRFVRTQRYTRFSARRYQERRIAGANTEREGGVAAAILRMVGMRRIRFSTKSNTITSGTCRGNRSGQETDKS